VSQKRIAIPREKKKTTRSKKSLEIFPRREDKPGPSSLPPRGKGWGRQKMRGGRQKKNPKLRKKKSKRRRLTPPYPISLIEAKKKLTSRSGIGHYLEKTLKLGENVEGCEGIIPGK